MYLVCVRALLSMCIFVAGFERLSSFYSALFEFDGKQKSGSLLELSET